jgi:Tol biopolymer transport system component
MHGSRQGTMAVSWMFVVTLLTVSGLATPAAGTFPGQSGPISFTRDSVGRPPNIYSINNDGSGLERVSEGGLNAFSLSWSADGRNLAFNTSRIGACSDVYIMNRGGRIRRLTDNRHCDVGPSWAPTGRRVIFASDRRDSAARNEGAAQKRGEHDYDLYTLRVDGSGLRQLTDSHKDEHCPSWSPDGRRIAYTVGRGHGADIYVMSVNGTRQRQITDATAADYCPDWSPDGEAVVFTTARHRTDLDRGNLEIYAVRPDDLQEVRLTNSSAIDEDPVWAPDGGQIVFTTRTSRSSDSDLVLIEPDGSSRIMLTRNKSTDLYPAWRPLVKP